MAKLYVGSVTTIGNFMVWEISLWPTTIFYNNKKNNNNNKNVEKKKFCYKFSSRSQRVWVICTYYYFFIYIKKIVRMS